MIFDIILQKFIFVITLGIGAQWLGWRLKIPSIILMAAAGILIGPVFKLVDPKNDFGDLIQILIKFAVPIILFEASLSLQLFELKKMSRAVIQLVFIGIPLAWGLGFIVCYFIRGLSLPVSLFLSALLVVSGPTVIMPLLRQSKLEPRLSSVLKWEGIINDPFGALLAVIVFEYFVHHSEQGFSIQVIYDLATAILIGLSMGVGAGYFLKFALKGSAVPEYLKAPITLCLVLLIYASSNLLEEESGLLAVTVFGITVANIGLVIIHELRRFKEYITVFLVSTIFVILTASLKTSHMALLSWKSLGFLLGYLFLVRPVSVFLSTIGSGLNIKERALLSWVAPRGVVAASMAGLIAPQMIAYGYKDAVYLVPLVFTIVLSTIVLHGSTLNWLARSLGLTTEKSDGILIVGASPWSIELAEVLHKANINVLVVDSFWHNLKEARQKSLPIYYGEVLSDAGEADIDLSGMGHMLAASENSAYNALVCSAFTAHFGRDRVFQLAFHNKHKSEKRNLSDSRYGQIAFDDHLHYQTLMSRYFDGGRFQKTQLTNEFKYEHFLAKSQGKAEPLILIQNKKHVVIKASDQQLSPEPGDILIYFINAGITGLSQKH